MAGEEGKTLGEQFARLDESLSGIHETQVRQEKALVDIFKENREAHGTMSRLDTVIRMSISEQKRINQELNDDITRLDGVWDSRGREIERKVAYFAGGLAVLLIVLNYIARIIF